MDSLRPPERDIVGRIRRPLDIAARDNFAMAGAIRDLHVAFRGIIAKVPQPSTTFAQFAERLLALIGDDFDTLAPEVRRERITRAVALTSEVCEPTSAPTPAPTSAPSPPLPSPGDAAQSATQDTLLVRRAPDPPWLEAERLLQQSTMLIPGVKEARCAALMEHGVATVGDLLFTLPRRWEDRRRVVRIAELQPGELAVATGRIMDMDRPEFIKGARKPFSILVADDSGSIILSWFHYGQREIPRRFSIGDQVRFSGKVTLYGMRRQMVHPSIDPAPDSADDPTEAITAVYSEVTGIPQAAYRRIVGAALDRYGECIRSVIPPEVAGGVARLALVDAVRRLHRPSPDSNSELLNSQRSEEHRRIAYEHLFTLQAALQFLRRRRRRQRGLPYEDRRHLQQAAVRSLSFNLTIAQQRALDQITRDLLAPSPMNRMLQGDVGCGKTAVAMLSALLPIANGAQVAMMVPTEVLATQQYEVMTRQLTPLGVRVGILIGGMNAASTRRTLKDCAEGNLDLVVGTHALIQQSVNFKRLGYVIIDEQHRFGVGQRGLLKGKGLEPDLLVMTATPIPRTLTLTLFGDLDLSVIDELPPGRLPVHTEIVLDGEIEQAYSILRRHIQEGRQLYIVYPLVEETEKSELRAATEQHRLLGEQQFQGVPMGLLHGRMSSEEKQQTLRMFRSGELRVLVATTVIEVGVDVPDAAVMVVEHAERFGLSQLHQLRGRVGRGGQQGYCYLVASGELSENARARLQVMVDSVNGFVIAEKDLELRGPGEYLGARQSGVPDEVLTSMLRHGDLVETAREQAARLLTADPSLAAPEHALLKRRIMTTWGERLRLTEAG